MQRKGLILLATVLLCSGCGKNQTDPASVKATEQIATESEETVKYNLIEETQTEAAEDGFSDYSRLQKLINEIERETKPE